MVVKIKSRTCIVLTADGEYREVSLPGGAVPRLGQEIKLEGRKRLPYLKQLMAVASVLIILMAGLLYIGNIPSAAAYLTIDINPSIELAVSSKGKVISASALDNEGGRILAEVKLKGRDLSEAVELIVAQAVTDNYIEESGDNVILATLTVASGTEPLVDLNSVYNAIILPLESSGLESDVIIEPVEPELREEAAATGISTGRYLLYNKSNQKGLQISISDITSMNLGKLQKEKKVDLVKIVAEQDNERSDNKQAQKDKTKQRGIYVKQQKSAGVQDKSQKKNEKLVNKQTGGNSVVKDQKNNVKNNGKDKRNGAADKNRKKEKSQKNNSKEDKSKYQKNNSKEDKSQKNKSQKDNSGGKSGYSGNDKSNRQVI